uniref:Ig-like domain-containing protein n=1 Tax=Salmo trutta TaxID=8032 RepID=A0A674BSX1_SALTR
KVYLKLSYTRSHTNEESNIFLGSGIRVISYNGRPTVTQGQHADLTCELIETDEELIQISWQKSTRGYRANHNFFLITPSYGPSHVKERGDRVGFIGNTTALVGSIRLGDVSLTDEGVYTCIFTVFPSGPYKAEIHLNVQIPPVISVAVETPPVVAEGQESILATCTAANAKPPADVRWSTASVRQPLSLTTSTNTTLNPDGTSTVRGHLKGEPSRVMHQQEVQCLVNHTTLSQQKVVPYEIDIHYPPNSVKIIIHERPPQAPAFQCLVDANPPPTEFTWKRSVGHSILFPLNPFSNGLYSCEVSNPYGAASGFLYVHKGNDCTWETVECEKPSNVAVLDTLNPVRLAPTTIFRFKGTYIFCVAHSPSEWQTYTIHVPIVSRLKNPSLTCLLSFIYTDLSGFNK